MENIPMRINKETYFGSDRPEEFSRGKEVVHK